MGAFFVGEVDEVEQRGLVARAIVFDDERAGRDILGARARPS